MKGQCGKTAGGENGAGETRLWRKIGAGETFLPAKFAAKNISSEILRRQMHANKIAVEFYFGGVTSLKPNFEMEKFRVIFESHCTVVVGGEKRTEICFTTGNPLLASSNMPPQNPPQISPPQICLGHAPSAKSGFEHLVFNVSPPFTRSKNKWDLSVSS